MDVTIAVCTFGDGEWVDLARERALPSAREQTNQVLHLHHLDSLQHARNAALEQIETEWVIYLDADDELEPGYVEAMAKGTADVRGPMARYVREGHRDRLWQPRVYGHQHDCVAECITSGAGNWLIVGAAVRTELARAAGGWRDWPCYEDFDFWMRVLQTGASVELIRDAIYRAHVRLDSRNRGPAIAHKDRVHHQIVAANLPDALRVA